VTSLRGGLREERRGWMVETRGYLVHELHSLIE
jgi:hypothetical protein